jgi:hypothetical protein
MADSRASDPLFPRKSDLSVIETRPISSSFYHEFYAQIKLMLWKRNLELSNQKYERLKYVVPPLLSFALVALLYSAFDLFNPGTIEVIF